MRIDFNSAACLKEVLQQRSTFIHKHASDNLGMVVELLLGEEIDHAAASAGLRIGRAEHDACDARMHHRACAHGARFKRDIQACSDKAVVTDTLRRSAHRLDLGVGSRIMTRNRRIVSFTDDFAIEYDTINLTYTLQPELEAKLDELIRLLRIVAESKAEAYNYPHRIPSPKG